MTDPELEKLFDDQIGDRLFFLSVTGFEMAAMRTGLELIMSMSMDDLPTELVASALTASEKMQQVAEAEARRKPADL